MVYYLYFQCSCYHLRLHVCFIGSRFSEARFGRGNKMIPQERNMKILSTQQLAQLLKKENHRPNRLKSVAYPPAVHFERNHMLQERIWFWCSFLCVHLPSLYKAISRIFFLFLQKYFIILGILFVTNSKRSAVGIAYPLLLNPDMFGFSLFCSIKKIQCCGSVNIAFDFDPRIRNPE